MERAEIYRKVLDLLENADDLLQGLSSDEYDYLTGRTFETLPAKLQARLNHIEKGMRSDWELATQTETRTP